MPNTEFFQKQLIQTNPIMAQILYWRGFFAKLVISCIVTTALAISTGLSGVNNWSDLAGPQKIIIICGIVGLAGKDIISLLDKSFSEKMNGKGTGAPNQPIPPVIADTP